MFGAMRTTAVLDPSDQDVMHILKEMVDEMQNQSVHNSSLDDANMWNFMKLLCQYIDSRNILTPTELSEYEAMVEAGEILHGKELEDVFSKVFPDGLQEIEDEDNCFITEEINMADSHIGVITQLQKTLNDEIQHVSSGMHQLEQQEKAAHFTLLAEGQNCIKLDLKVRSAQEELLKRLQCLAELSTDFKNVKSAPQLMGQLPLETYRKRCRQFDRYVKIMMKQCLEWNEPLVGEYEDDYLEELEQSFIEMKMEYIYMLASDQGRRTVIKNLQDIVNDIQASKFTVSFSEIRNQCLLLEEKVIGSKGQVSLMFENELLPAVEASVKMDVLQIKRYRNEQKHCKLKRIFKQNKCLARCLETGLTDSELLLLLLVCERQKLVDMADLYQQCLQEINEEYLEFTSRMKAVQELRGKNCSYSLVMENLLIHCMVQLLYDEHSGNAPTNIHELMLNVKNLNKDIINQEEKLFDSLFNKQKNVLLRNENSIKTAEKYLYAGLSKKLVLLRMEISTCCNNTEQLLESFQEVLKRIKENYKRKQVFFSEKPFHQEQRLLWIHFLMDPKKLVALIRHLEELTEKRINHNMLKYQKNKRRDTRFFPQGMQK